MSLTSEGGIQFESVQEEDLPRLNKLVNDLDIVEYLDLIPPVPLATTRMFFASVQNGRASWWTIAKKGTIIGGVGILPERPDTKLAHSGTMFLYLVKECWGQGIGGRAVRFALKEAKRQELERVEVMVVDENERALRLFRRNGFTIEGVKKEVFNLRGTYHDMVMMARFL
ncbi:MAG: GNAT family N-acetyltransferase [Methanomicrobiales archaeon]|nr:GNAT family N-acetyltransferase [Methanomicrobiales archaeon]